MSSEEALLLGVIGVQEAPGVGLSAITRPHPGHAVTWVYRQGWLASRVLFYMCSN